MRKRQFVTTRVISCVPFFATTSLDWPHLPSLSRARLLNLSPVGVDFMTPNVKTQEREDRSPAQVQSRRWCIESDGAKLGLNPPKTPPRPQMDHSWAEQIEFSSPILGQLPQHCSSPRESANSLRSTEEAGMGVFIPLFGV